MCFSGWPWSATPNEWTFLSISVHQLFPCIYSMLYSSLSCLQFYLQSTITTFFRPITPTHATSQSRATQEGSWPGNCKGVTINQAIATFRACRPQPLWTMISPSMSSTDKCHHLLPSQVLPSFQRPLHLNWPMLEIFRKQNYNISDFRILHV